MLHVSSMALMSHVLLSGSRSCEDVRVYDFPCSTNRSAQDGSRQALPIVNCPKEAKEPFSSRIHPENIGEMVFLVVTACLGDRPDDNCSCCGWPDRLPLQTDPILKS